jgi:hypothetical protein
MVELKNAPWWSSQCDEAWHRLRPKFRNQWDQTKLDINEAGEAPFKTMLKSRTGSTTFEDMEPAYRFGLGSRLSFGDQYPDWNEELENHLRKDWLTIYPYRQDCWELDLEAIRFGWEFEDEV